MMINMKTKLHHLLAPKDGLPLVKHIKGLLMAVGSMQEHLLRVEAVYLRLIQRVLALAIPVN